MPIIIPPDSIDLENLDLAGLNLNQGTTGAIQLEAFTPPYTRKRYEWVEGADSDGALLARDPLVSNGQATCRLRVIGATRDDAQGIIGQIVDKLEEADRNPLGIPLTWVPAGSTPQLTFYVLTGEVTELPVTIEDGYFVNMPVVSITMDCRPFGYGTPVAYGPVTAAGPLVTLDLADVPGDAPGEAVLTITDMSTSRRTVEWGAEHRHYNPAAAWPLILDSDSLVTSGFSGTQTTRTGAYDPGATGNSIITSVVASQYQAICGTGAQPHIGTFRVKARIFDPGATDAYVRLSWRAGDGVYRANDPAHITWPGRFGEIDLGLITIPVALTGTQAWDGTIEGYSAAGADPIEVDYLELFPTEAGYGKATSPYAYKPGVISARDGFTGITAGTALNGRTAEAGGTWATSGAATDLTARDFSGGEQMGRATSLEADYRYAILGSTTSTDSEVSVRFQQGTSVNGNVSVVFARYIDGTNYFAFNVAPDGLGVFTMIAGSAVYLADVTRTQPINTWYAARLVVYASGQWIATLLSENGLILWTESGRDATLATGGALASGKRGFGDYNSGSSVAVRYYDDFTVSTPAAEPFALYAGRKLKISTDATERESSAGGTWGRPALYRGTRFKVQPAGVEDRTTRVAVKASRNDLDSAADDNLDDQIKLEATVTPRYSVVPR